MTKERISRRDLFIAAAAGGAIAAAGHHRPLARAAGRPHVACNQYTWVIYYRRDNLNFLESLDRGLAEVAQSGMDGFEPTINRPEDVDRFAPLLKTHALEMRSIYVNSTLHRQDEVEASAAEILAIAGKARAAGTRIIVTNPSPIRWGGPENKDDTQLRIQASAMNKLGARLKELGVTLAYHNHDIELRNAAREFHHMMAGTDPANVTLCLDCHWVYRGSGNSAVALSDIIKLYGSRVSSLHLRQSVGAVWSETLGEGDIDYASVAADLMKLGVKPHLVLEQAPEKGTPKTLTPLDAHRKSRAFIDAVFAGFS